MSSNYMSVNMFIKTFVKLIILSYIQVNIYICIYEYI